MKFTLRGQIGGDGVQPVAIGEEGRGEKGPPGKDGKEHQHYVASTDNTKEKCDLQPTSGGKGGKGISGLPGTSGLPGGSSGKLFLEISPAAAISYSVEKFIGQGGNGSPGGFGGPGGYPGDPGKIIISYSSEDGNPWGTKRYWNGSCAIPAPGPMGDEGNQGAPGPIGGDGVIEKSCVKYIGEVTEACEL